MLHFTSVNELANSKIFLVIDFRFFVEKALFFYSPLNEIVPVKKRKGSVKVPNNQ